MRGKIKLNLIQPRSGRQKIKVRFLGLAVALICSASYIGSPAKAEHCPSLRVVFARGSGGKLNTDPNYLEYKETIESKLATVDLDYEFIDLDYPAVGVGLDNLKVTLGAYIGAGETYEFGESVNKGVSKLINLVNNGCPNTKYVIGGYSQGAMVVSKSLKSLRADKVIYAATFGDPKIYLPEGKGMMPVACSNKNLSDYRIYVPDCHAYEGLLGSYRPYRPEGLAGKVGTWCNKRDVFCSSKFNISDHLAYISDNLYEDASRLIFDKITKAFGLENRVSSPHDTAFLIDSTGSMDRLIDRYKNEALRLAKETLGSGGRVALYDYRDLSDPYEPVEHCNFENCTLEKFEAGLKNIKVDGGGDTLESLMSASFKTMKQLNWKLGATKSLVVLTDSGFLEPDRDGMTMKEVVALSKSIDPVNFYIITEPDTVEYYGELANATDGKVAVLDDKVNLLTDYIMERYDSLPRVEEESEAIHKPTLDVIYSNMVGDTATVKFKSSGDKTIVILNDRVIGMTDEEEITISGINDAVINNLLLVPVLDDVRGDGVTVNLNSGKGEVRPASFLIPKAPDTGQR